MIPLQPAPAGLPSRSFGGPRRRTDDRAAGWHWLLVAPHRLGFFAGGLALALTAAWWAVMLVARHGGVVVPWAVSPAVAHGLAMGYGFMPLFVMGFLFTAGPRWLGVEPLPVRALLPGVGLLAAGWGVALAGFHLSAPVAGLGLGVVCLGLMLMTAQFGLLLAASPMTDRDHPHLVLLALGLAALSLWAAALAVTLGADAPARAATRAGLWGGFALLFVTVAHRMIPFFTAAALPGNAAWRPRAVLLALAAMVLLQVPFSVAEVLGRQAAPLALVRGALEWLAGLLLFWLSVRWGLRQSLRIRLLAMLHMGFFWLAVAFTLSGCSHVLQGMTDGAVTLGLAPLHAFTMGYLGSTLLAMATRVACGHGGRALVADRTVWLLFWVLQLGVVARVTAALWPAAGTPLTLLAAQAWLAAMGAWAWRYGRWMLAPRADGRPG